MNPVIVTGAGGFVGRHVVTALMAQQHDVHAVGRREALDRDTLPPGACWHAVDMHDDAAIGRLMAAVRPRCLVHLAWVTTPGLYWNDPSNRSWMLASQRLFHSFAAAGGRRIVVAGTSAEYDWEAAQPLREDASPLKPAGLYGDAKNELRMYLQSWAPTVGVSWAWARLFNVFGPHEKRERLVPRTVCSLLAGNRVSLDGGTLVRDFLHVGDAADAFVAIARSDFMGPINVASGEGVAIRDLVTMIAEYLDATELVEFTAPRRQADEPAVVVGSSRLLREAVGWEPRLGLQGGLRQTCQWWRAHSGISSAT